MRFVTARFDERRVDVARHRIDVDQHRRRPEVADRLHGRDESVRGRDDLVARPNPFGGDRDVERRGARVQRDRMLAPT